MKTTTIAAKRNSLFWRYYKLSFDRYKKQQMNTDSMKRSVQPNSMPFLYYKIMKAFV
ncbi:MAG: hypothetical protein ACE3JN_04350 [Ectobacillus sp.]